MAGRERAAAAAVLLAAAGGVRAAGFDGASASAWWAVPFAGTLLSLALVPLFAPFFWGRHFGKVIAAWGLAFALPFAAAFGLPAIAGMAAHALVQEYAPFILLLTALYAVAGGIFVDADLRASPAVNTGLIATGGVLASVMGTTGAAMLLIRLLLRLNRGRPRCAHVVVFFIFIVANIGGSLTPLGDPPLFLGFLRGVPFFWTLQHLAVQTAALVAALLVIFYVLDRRHFAREPAREPARTAATSGRIAVRGVLNGVLLAAIVGLVLMSGVWQSPVRVELGGVGLALPDVVRDAGLALVTVFSIAFTPRAVRRANGFTWAPMAEVAKIFAGIFLTIAPVIAMLQAGVHGPFAPLVLAVTGPGGEPLPAMYFWAAGALSSVLDNAPTYLVFFNTAGGDPAVLTTALAGTLAAVSAGAVFMGANTYIGNAPNLMVKAVAEEQGVAMPGFFGYMAWSLGILLPLFAIVTLIWYL